MKSIKENYVLENAECTLVGQIPCILKHREKTVFRELFLMMDDEDDLVSVDYNKIVSKSLQHNDESIFMRKHHGTR